MDLVGNRRKRTHTTILANTLKDCYPNDLQLYLLPPSNEIQLAEFEELALERLQLFRTIDQPFAASARSEESVTKTDWKAQKDEQARIRKQQNDLKKTEEEIHKLETRSEEIDELLTKEEIYTDVARLLELNTEKSDLSTKLEQLYEQWEALAE